MKFTNGMRVKLFLVLLLWALCFPFIVVGLSRTSPFYFAALRSALAGAGLLLPALLMRRSLPRTPAVWLAILGAGIGASTLGFSGMFLGGGKVSPGLATVLANTQPLIAAMLAYFALDERLSSNHRMGLILGFAGIVLVALPGMGGVDTNSTPLGVAYVLLGALGVAGGNILLKHLSARVDPLMAVGWQFTLGSVPLFLAALLFESPGQTVWDGQFIVALFGLALPGTALAYLLWFGLLRQRALTRLNTLTFLTPMIALLIGALFFREMLNSLELTGIAMTLIGVAWASRADSFPPEDEGPGGRRLVIPDNARGKEQHLPSAHHASGLIPALAGLTRGLLPVRARGGESRNLRSPDGLHGEK